jgi:hypothetical protein
MFIFVVIAAAALAGGAATLVGDVLHKGQISDRIALKKNKKAFKPEVSSQIIGLQNPTLVKLPTTLTTTKFDTTTYNDRAVVTLTNSTGSDVTTHGFAIRGKPVMQYSGEAGYTFEYSDYADIEINGENSYEISNRFITSGAQCEDLGDWSWKELKPHDMYAVSCHGVGAFYEIGDVQHLAVTNLVSGASSENELIDVDVEIEGVSIRKTIGELGETLLDVRVPSGVWNKTTSMRARRIAAGSPGGINNRGNVLTVASSTWTGQADYYCDGDHDEVEILAALDNLQSGGGGELILTNGYFDIVGENGIYINAMSNIIIRGSGWGTILTHSDTSASKHTIYLYNSTNILLRDFTIDGASVVHSSSNYGIRWNSGCSTLRIEKIKAENIYASTSTGTAIGINGAEYDVVDNAVITSGCIVHNINANIAAGIGHCDSTDNNVIYDVTGVAVGYGMFSCLRAFKNQVGTISGVISAKYNLVYADSTASNPAADTADGGFNS